GRARTPAAPARTASELLAIHRWRQRAATPAAQARRSPPRRPWPAPTRALPGQRGPRARLLPTRRGGTRAARAPARRGTRVATDAPADISQPGRRRVPRRGE